ncbi:hypothetical protein MTO96_016942 [Rhipicephalus appendiculatus]
MFSSMPDTSSSGCALHQVEANRHNEQTAHGAELSGDSTGFVSDDAHVVHQRVADLVSGAVSCGSRDDEINLPPAALSLHDDQRRLSSDNDHTNMMMHCGVSEKLNKTAVMKVVLTGAGGKRKKKRKTYDDEGEMPLPQPPQTMLNRATHSPGDRQARTKPARVPSLLQHSAYSEGMHGAVASSGRELHLQNFTRQNAYDGSPELRSDYSDE